MVFALQAEKLVGKMMYRAGKRLMRKTKADMLSTIGMCMGITLAFIDLRQQYDYLKVTMDILRDENRAMIQQLEAMEDAYYKAEAVGFKCWRDETKKSSTGCWMRFPAIYGFNNNRRKEVYTMPNGTCRSCGASIVWIKTEKGKHMPCNPQLVPYWERPGAAGKIILQQSGRVVSCEFDGPREEVTGFGYISHFSTCPQSRQFKRK